jgi:histidyl-tRNA synthetase
MYNLETSGGDRLTLRPEGTAAVMRAYIEHGMGSLPQPLMFYYGGPFFRHEKPQKGRYRQLYQFGLEIMGSKNPAHDALIIQAGYDIVKKSGKEIFVEINSIGNTEERADYIKKLKEFYKEHENEIGENDRARIETNPLLILDSKNEDTIKINENAPDLLDSLGMESRVFFDDVLDYLDVLSIPYEIKPFLVRGLDYYEHTVFEYVTLDENGNKSHALGGGGRYDGLAETLGHNKAIPSVGLGLGADRIVEIAEEESFKNTKEKTEIFFISLGKESHGKALSLTKGFKNENIHLKLNLSDQKIGKQFEKAEKQGFEYVLVLGGDEIKNNSIILKNLKTRKQKEIDLNNFENELENL